MDLHRPPTSMGEWMERLVPGIAHEIGTPTQSVGNTVYFLRGVWDDLVPLLEAVEAICARAQGEDVSAGDLTRIRESLARADLAYLRAEVPAALSDCGGQARRIADMVHAVRAFVRPDGGRPEAARLVTDTLLVARHEVKYVADIHTELENGPVAGDASAAEVGLDLLRRVVQAADLIARARQEHGVNEPGVDERGVVAVRTRRVEGGLAIDVTARPAGAVEESRIE